MIHAHSSRSLRLLLRGLWIIAGCLGIAILMLRPGGVLTKMQLERVGREHDANPAFTAPVSSAPLTASIDAVAWGDHPPVLIATTSFIRVPAATALSIGGWAFDQHADRNIAALGVEVDGRAPAISAELRLIRPDVAAALRRPRAEESGFSLTIPPGRLPLGPHKLELRALGADGRVAYRLTPQIAVDVVTPAAANRPTDAIDALNGVVVNAPASVTSPVGILRGIAELSVSGWAVTPDGVHRIRALTPLLDGTPEPRARYGMERPDVARTFADPTLARSGFMAHIPIAGLGDGPHTITFRLDLDDGTSVPGSSSLRFALE